jgi:hemerythrin-like domain-containing protein
MLRILRAIGRRAEAGEPVEAGDLAECVEFLRVFVDACHHGKEERLLFPAMLEAGLSGTPGVIGRLLDDHVHGREAVGRLSAWAGRLGEDDARAREAIAQAVTDYAGVLRAHILLEETVCFDAADKGLPAATQQRLQDGYDRVERDVIGEGRHEQFHRLLERLDAAYRAPEEARL